MPSRHPLRTRKITGIRNHDRALRLTKPIKPVSRFRDLSGPSSKPGIVSAPNLFDRVSGDALGLAGSIGRACRRSTGRQQMAPDPVGPPRSCCRPRAVRRPETNPLQSARCPENRQPPFVDRRKVAPRLRSRILRRPRPARLTEELRDPAVSMTSSPGAMRVHRRSIARGDAVGRIRRRQSARARACRSSLGGRAPGSPGLGFELKTVAFSAAD